MPTVAEAPLQLATQTTAGGVGGEVRVAVHRDAHVVGRGAAREPRHARVKRCERRGGIDERRHSHVDDRHIAREPRDLRAIECRAHGRCRGGRSVLRRDRLGRSVFRRPRVRAVARADGGQSERGGLPGPHGVDATAQRGGSRKSGESGSVPARAAGPAVVARPVAQHAHRLSRARGRPARHGACSREGMRWLQYLAFGLAFIGAQACAADDSRLRR